MRAAWEAKPGPKPPWRPWVVAGLGGASLAAGVALTDTPQSRAERALAMADEKPLPDVGAILDQNGRAFDLMLLLAQDVLNLIEDADLTMAYGMTVVVDARTKERDEAWAACAALREAAEYGLEFTYGELQGTGREPVVEKYMEALAPDAGTAILKELQSLRRVAEAARNVRYWHGNIETGDDIDEQVRCNIELDDALESINDT